MVEDLPKNNPAFYRFGGVIGRAAFFINSIIIASLFGASFILFLGNPRGLETVHLTPLGSLQAFTQNIFMGAIYGSIFVLSGGLTALFGALFYAILFTFGSVLSLREARSVIDLATGLVMTYLVVLACANVTKRVRDILKTDQKVRVWTAAIILLSLIPFIGTIAYLFLIFLPRESSSRL